MIWHHRFSVGPLKANHPMLIPITLSVSSGALHRDKLCLTGEAAKLSLGLGCV